MSSPDPVQVTAQPDAIALTVINTEADRYVFVIGRAMSALPVSKRVELADYIADVMTEFAIQYREMS